jgi:hypothetical protein
MKQRLFILFSVLSLLIFAATLTLWLRAAIGGDLVWRHKSATFSSACFFGSGYLHYESLTDPTTQLIAAMECLHADPIIRTKDFQTDQNVLFSFGDHAVIASGKARFFSFSGTIFVVSVNYLPIVLLSAIGPIVWIYGKVRRPVDQCL